MLECSLSLDQNMFWVFKSHFIVDKFNLDMDCLVKGDTVHDLQQNIYCKLKAYTLSLAEPITDWTLGNKVQ